MDMRVSIVVNNYNYERYLAAAIDSALAQDHPDTEVIVVDDGSTDGSRDLLERYRGRVRLILTENGGQSAAINTGFAAVTGEAVNFLDADDILLPDAASRVSALLEAHPEVARIHARALVIDESGVANGDVRPPAHRALPGGDLRAAELAAPLDMVTVGTTGNMFRRSALAQVMPIPAARYGGSGADWYLIHTTTLVGEVLVEERPFNYYRLHPHNAFGNEGLDLDQSRTKIRFERATLQSLEEVADRLELPRPSRLVSMSHALSRITSLRFAPEQHPLEGDTRRQVLIDAALATWRRRDASWPVRLGVATWCVALAYAPLAITRRLVGMLVEPPPILRALLKRLHGTPRAATGLAD
jgi:hypothetical protein